MSMFVFHGIWHACKKLPKKFFFATIVVIHKPTLHLEGRSNQVWAHCTLHLPALQKILFFFFAFKEIKLNALKGFMTMLYEFEINTIFLPTCNPLIAHCLRSLFAEVKKSVFNQYRNTHVFIQCRLILLYTILVLLAQIVLYPHQLFCMHKA